MPTLVSSIFSRRPNESTVVADVYKSNTSVTINSYQDISSSSFDLNAQLGFLSKRASGLSLNLAFGNSQGLFGGAGNAIANVGAALSDAQAKASSLYQGLMADISPVVQGIRTGIGVATSLAREGEAIYATVNGVVQTIEHADLTSLRGIERTINSVIGQTGFSLSPNGPMGTLMTQLFGTAGAAGVSGIFDVFASGITGAESLVNKSEMIYNVATKCLPNALARGDINSVISMTNYVGNGTLSMISPNAVPMLMQNDRSIYGAVEICGNGGAPGQYVTYVNAYRQIDPNWDRSEFQVPTQTINPPDYISSNPDGTTTNGNYVSYQDVSSLMTASPEVKNTFSTGAINSDNDADKIHALGSVYDTPPTVDSELNRQYPDTNLSNNTTVTPDTSPNAEDRFFSQGIQPGSNKEYYTAGVYFPPGTP